jgi:hypothetical protein
MQVGFDTYEYTIENISMTLPLEAEEKETALFIEFYKR